MSATTLDIIDAAVKIGLGAVIGGVTSYINTNQKQKHDSTQTSLSDRKELLLEITKQVDLSITLIDKASISLNLKGQNETEEQSEIEDELALLDESGEALKIARTNCYLIGHEEMAKTTEKYHDALTRYHEYLLKNKRNLDQDYVEKENKQLKEIVMSIRNQYMTAFESIYEKKIS